MHTRGDWNSFAKQFKDFSSSNVAAFLDVEALSLHRGKLGLFVFIMCACCTAVIIALVYFNAHYFISRILLILESLRCWFIVGSFDPIKVQILISVDLFVFCMYVSFSVVQVFPVIVLSGD